MKKSELKGSSVLLLGYGREGRSVHRYLEKNFPELKVDISDQNPARNLIPSKRKSKVYSGKNYLSRVHKYDILVRSPGIPLRTPELHESLSRGQRITSLTNLFMASVPGKVIGVTGTKGKSTTASLIAAILSQLHDDVRLVGNIGRPALDALEGADKNTVFVMEFSSFQLEDLRYSPSIAVLLGIYPEHLDYHGSYEHYVESKFNILRHQTSSDITVLQGKILRSKPLPENHCARTILFSKTRSIGVYCFAQGDALYLLGKANALLEVLPLSDIPLLGPGNLENVLASVTVGSLLHVPLTRIAHAVRTFKSLEHRLECLGEYRGITFYNDSLSTIPQSAANALVGLGSKVETLLAGGHDRGVDFSPLAKSLQKSSIKTLILFPTTGKRICEALEKEGGIHNRELDIFHVQSMEEAVAKAFETTSIGKICLMSPASSSLNMFQDYQERGEAFRRCIIEQSSAPS